RRGLTPVICGREGLSSTRRKGVVPAQGETKWLAGVSGYLADAVLKAELDGALLVEVGNGLDYFGSHSALVSPDKESQLFLGLSNHSTPVTLGASFFRGNLGSYDTVTIQSCNVQDEDCKEIQDYAITFRGLEASAG